MKNGSKIAIIGGVVVLLVVLLYYFGFRNQSDGDYVSDDWSMSYKPESLDPYGTYTLKELVDTFGLFGNFLELNRPLEKTLQDNPDQNDIYFFVGGKNYLSDSSAQFLLDFIRKGNTAFISTENFPSALCKEILYDQDLIFLPQVVDSSQYLKFSHPSLRGKRYRFDFIYNNKKETKIWTYFDPYAFNTEVVDTILFLGSNTKDQSNYLKIEWGEGALFLHSTPYVFTNISLFKRDGFQYAENVLKHIPPGRVQWDRYNLEHHFSSSSSSNDADENNGQGGEKRESILQFIINNPPLLWAFLTLLIGAVIYALFKGKRMQKIIPATEAKNNMSLQYISTLSSLYLQEKKHNKLIKLKERTFLNFIANRYYIHSNKPDQWFVQKLAIKSHINEKTIWDIFNSFDYLENKSEVTDLELIDLHKKIEHFYKTCS